MEFRVDLGGDSPQLDPRADQLVQLLVDDAIRRVPLTVAQGELRAFAGGTRAAFVGALRLAPAPRSVVVKIDTEDVTREARHLLRTAEDPRLPASFRRALPAVYAIGSIDGDPPLHGYLMEDLSGSHETLSSHLVDGRRAGHATQLVAALWEVLEGAYAATRSTAVLPNVEQHYVDKIVPGLELASAAEPRLAHDRPIAVRVGTERIELPPWGEVIAAARRVAATCGPPFATATHGDCHAWNVLVRTSAEGIDLRLIDLSEGVHDYVQDVARTVTSLRYLHVVDGNGLASPPQLASAGDATEIAYQLGPRPQSLRDAEDVLVARAGAFAAAHGDEGAATRLQLAVGSTLLALLPNLATGDARWRAIALFAFAEGLRTMWAAATA